MRFALEFHDSEVRDVVADGDVVRLRFSAAAVRNDEGERGWLAGVQLRMSAATLQGDATQAFGKITEASLRHDAQRCARLVVPGAWAGDLELTLRLANGTQLAARGQALVATVGANGLFMEDWSC